uniref:Peptidase S1 domain-containing protein n=1 Tax=Ditylenchus dipsaci TaxID=166011 RepID=A0A915D925_9BILA
MKLNCLAILFVCQGLIFVKGLLNGNLVEWNQYRSLVKVLARSENLDVQSCTGSLISPSLILTASECVIHRTARVRMSEFLVIMTQADKTIRKLSGKLVDLAEDWALLQISPQNISELCLPYPAPNGITRLNLKPSLLSPAFLDIPNSSIGKLNCHILGFVHTDKASDFVKQQKVFKMDLEHLTETVSDNQKIYRSRIFMNYTACFDDTGTALICNVMGYGPLQLGMFQSLNVASDKEMDLNSSSVCSQALDMQFSISVKDEWLVAAIQRHSFAELVAAYKLCQFI